MTSPELKNPMNDDIDDRKLTIKIFAQNIFDGKCCYGRGIVDGDDVNGRKIG